MSHLFGTDGIRAVAGHYPLNHTSIYTLGKTLISIIKKESLSPKVIIGRDTRESGKWIEQSLIQGIHSEKGTAVSTGIIPTSAISYLTKKHHFSAGIVISASHNPYKDNGIKIFSSDGKKISKKWENIIDKSISLQKKEVDKKNIDIIQDNTYSKEYRNFLKSRFSNISHKNNLSLVVDCSNGASSFYAPNIFSELGFQIKTIHTTPNGKNINKSCGTQHPEGLAKHVIEHNADIGIAYDGDADRAIWVDDQGNILNGDHTLFVFSQFMKKKELLKSNYVVSTKLSNIGLEKALNKMGIKLLRTPVGDKYVLEQMEKVKTNLGGEQSGHTILLDECPTGDGILTSLKMLEILGEENKPLSKLVEDYQEYPQIFYNVPVSQKKDFYKFPEIADTIQNIKKKLEHSGRVEIRYSGTENLARIMVEGKDKNTISSYGRQLVKVLKKHL